MRGRAQVSAAATPLREGDQPRARAAAPPLREGGAEGGAFPGSRLEGEAPRHRTRWRAAAAAQSLGAARRGGAEINWVQGTARPRIGPQPAMNRRALMPRSGCRHGASGVRRRQPAACVCPASACGECVIHYYYYPTTTHFTDLLTASGRPTGAQRSGAAGADPGAPPTPPSERRRGGGWPPPHPGRGAATGESPARGRASAPQGGLTGDGPESPMISHGEIREPSRSNEAESSSAASFVRARRLRSSGARNPGVRRGGGGSTWAASATLSIPTRPSREHDT